MGPAGPILLVTLCAMLQMPTADPARVIARSHHHRRPTDPPIDRMDKLSSLCCGEGQVVDVAAAVCRPHRPHRALGPAHSLLQRSGLTDLPPNCPPPLKYDHEAKVCRDVWRRR